MAKMAASLNALSASLFAILAAQPASAINSATISLPAQQEVLPATYYEAYRAFKKLLENGQSSRAFRMINHAIDLASKKLDPKHESLIAFRVNRLNVAATLPEPNYRDAFNFKQEIKTLPDLVVETEGAYSDHHISVEISAAKIELKSTGKPLVGNPVRRLNRLLKGMKKTTQKSVPSLR